MLTKTTTDEPRLCVHDGDQRKKNERGKHRVTCSLPAAAAADPSEKAMHRSSEISPSFNLLLSPWLRITLFSLFLTLTIIIMMLTTLASITRIIRLNSNNIRPAFNPHRPHCCCCRCSSSSSSPSLATAGSSNAQKKENNNPAPGCLRIGILSLPSSLPDVINQFESYLLSELQHKYSPQVQVIRIPHQRDQHKDGTGDHVSHDADDGDDVIRGWVHNQTSHFHFPFRVRGFCTAAWLSVASPVRKKKGEISEWDRSHVNQGWTSAWNEGNLIFSFSSTSCSYFHVHLTSLPFRASWLMFA